MTDEQKMAGQKVYRLAKALGVAMTQAGKLGLKVTEPEFTWINLGDGHLHPGGLSRKILQGVEVEVSVHEMIPHE